MMTESAETTQGLKTTPLTGWHERNGGRLVEFAGYQMPVQYGSIVAEHTATRQAAALFDVSHMARLRFEGDRAIQLLDHLLTRRVDDMRVGQVRYSMICNVEGGILDDVLLSYLESPSGRNYYLLVVNAGNHEKIVKWLRPHLAEYPDVAFTDVTDQTAMVAVQGPSATKFVEKLFPDNPGRIIGLRYYRSLVTKQMNKPVIVSRTGYTGEDGFELIVRSEDAERIWENLMLAGRDDGIQAAGLGARDTLRLEAGMPLYGHELSEQIDPLTAGLDFAVNLKDRSFIGSDSLREKSQLPIAQRRVGLKLDGRRAAREGTAVLDASGGAIGTVTSGTFSPTFQQPIAMAYVNSNFSQIGTRVVVDIRGSKVDADVVALPFYTKASN